MRETNPKRGGQGPKRSDPSARRGENFEWREREFRALADNVPALFSYIDSGQRYRYVNLGYEKAWGRKAEDIIGRTVEQVLGPEGFSTARPHIEAALEGRDVTYESGFEMADGSHTMRVHYVPDTDESGVVLGFFALITDITTERRAEETAREGEQRLRLALREAGGGVWDWDLTRDEAWWSPEMYDLWGIAQDTPMNLKNSLGAVHEEDRELVDGAVQEALAREGEYRLEFRIRHPVVGERWVASRGRLIRDASGKVVRMRGITLDVTERKRAEEARRKTEERMRAILETAADAIITIDGRGIIQEVNPATLDMFGYSREELEGQNVSILMPEPHRSEHDGYISRYLKTGEARIIGTGREALAVRKDGSTFPADLTVSEAEHLNLFTGFIRDISDRKRIERELQKSRDDLRRVSSELMLTEERERRELAQDLHDSLGQALFLLSRKLPEAPLEDRTIDELRAIVDEAARTVNALTFELSPPVLKDLGLRPAIQWLARDLGKRYDLSIRIEEEAPPFRVDERVATIVFRSVRELLINTAKHAGTDTATVRFREAGRSGEVTVEDEGCGFDLAAQPDHVEAGHFGLFSIRERMEYLGGQLTIRSAPGEGTTITLTVPLASVDANA